MDEFLKLYPRIAADFKGAESSAPLQLLKNHPYLMEKISNAWGTNDAEPFLNGILIADRMGREGFSTRIAAELVFLKHLHAFVYDIAIGRSNRVEDLIHKGARPRSMRDLVIRYGLSDGRPAVPGISILRAPGWGEIGSAIELRKTFIESNFQRRKRIGEYLVDYKVITEDDVTQALKIQSESGVPRKYLGDVLQWMGKISEQDIEKSLCLQNNLLLVDLDAIPISREALIAAGHDAAVDTGFIPLLKIGRTLIAATESPTTKRSILAWNEFSKIVKLNVMVCWADPNAVMRRLENFKLGRVERT